MVNKRKNISPIKRRSPISRNKKVNVNKKQKKKPTQKKICLTKAVKRIKNQIHKEKPDTLGDAIGVALKAAKNLKKKVKPTRVVKIPKTGGVLPLIPIFAGLSALGALSGGAAGIAKAVNDARSAKQQLQESHRHNKTMEAIALGKGMKIKKNGESGIINMDSKDNPGTHWTAYKKIGPTVLYFDSYDESNCKFYIDDHVIEIPEGSYEIADIEYFVLEKLAEINYERELEQYNKQQQQQQQQQRATTTAKKRCYISSDEIKSQHTKDLNENN
ncbi:hypothetical protein NQ315_012268 [Exocentrus adspersus]|uniref:Uncharacterized protein n=1 Tax=Exocentrus adspersus TaxID=1586481 RepID=A0AAV8VET1_9CUCU|nr:hypothetical protein NQ315_012268 [Exocentrus adspersus]